MLQTDKKSFYLLLHVCHILKAIDGLTTVWISTSATDAAIEQDNITRAGAIAPLIALLDHHDLRELAAAVLAKLAHDHEDNQSATWRLIQLMHADRFGESEYGNANISHMLPCMECSPTFIIKESQVQCSEHRAYLIW